MNTKAFIGTLRAFDWREENRTARRRTLKPALLIAASFSLVALPRADVITDWNDTAIKVFKAAGIGGVAPTRHLALVHVAQFDAVNAVVGGYTPYFTSLAAPGASAEAAAAQAAYAVLKALFPTNSLADPALVASLATVPDGAPKTDGIALGNATATALLLVRAGDGFNASVHYTPLTPAPGAWQPATNSPIVSPQWRYVNPWTMTGASQFRAAPPPALTSDIYTADFNEIKSLGSTNSVTRTTNQTDIGFFHVELQHYLAGYAARAVLATRPLPLVQSARLFALIALAQADAAITEWDTKYTYNLWRPQTAIRDADTDGNPDTSGDPNWSSLRPSPNHPEYAGAAAIIMTAATEVLADVFGDETAFTFESPTLPGKPRTFARFSDLSADTVNARVYTGFHFRNSSMVGVATGRQIAQLVLRNFLLPLPSAVSGQPQTNGAFQLNLLAIGARPYVIETSSDLTSWMPWKTNLTGLVNEFDPGALDGNRKFYRTVAR